MIRVLFYMGMDGRSIIVTMAVMIWATWIIEAAIGLYVLFMAALIVFGATRMLWRQLYFLSRALVPFASEKIAGGIIGAFGLVFFFTGRLIAFAFSPLTNAMKAAQAKKEEAGQVWKTSDPISEAKKVLGLPDQFTATDLKSRYRDLMKRVHVDVGGTDWLAEQVNRANSLLKKVAK